jgi:hypothetical protein
MRLLFQASRISRATTRDQWRLIHRWRRETEKEFRQRDARSLEVAAILPADHPYRRRALDHLVNPPIMVFP